MAKSNIAATSKKPNSKASTKTIIEQDDLPELMQSLVDLDLDTFPSEFTQDTQSHWLIWNPVPNANPCTKVLKKPVNSAWQKKDSLLTFSDAHDVYMQRGGNLGFGFAYNLDHPFICIDIDLATDDNEELMQTLKSYTEWSPSQKGLHVIVQTETLADKILLKEEFGNGKRNKSEERDLFISNGYVTVTGKQLPTTPGAIRTFDYKELRDILAYYFLSNVTSLPSRNKKAEDRQKELFEQVASSTSGTKSKQPKKTKDKRKPLTIAQVNSLLKQVPVRNLTSDIFEKLYHNQMCIIDPECDEEAREPWLIIGQAIHNNFGGRLEGYYAWDQWSQEGDKYNAEACTATWESFTELSEKVVTIAALIKLVKAQHPQFPDINAKGAFMGTVENFYTYLDFYKFEIAHNEITKELIIEPPKEIQKRWRIDTLPKGQQPSLGEICEFILSDLLILGFTQAAFSSQKIKKFITSLGRTKSFNPIREYFHKCGTKWDGKDRLSELMGTITTEPLDKQFRPAYRMFLRKWLIQVMAAACHAAAHPVRLNRVVIFSGPQNIGKTRWVESLFPKILRGYCAADKEIRISNFRSDNVKQTMELSNTLIANINEIDRLFKSAQFSDFKAFLDQTSDKIVLPYGEAPVPVTRRTVFIGSTNMDQFLKDHTGNRRFEVIHAIALNFRHEIDVDQLWGQAYNWYKGGEKWWMEESDPLEKTCIERRDEINMRSMFVGSDSLVEQLEDMYDTDAPRDKFVGQTFKDIRLTLGLSHLTTNSKAFNSTKKALAIWSHNISGDPCYNGPGKRPKVFYWMPPIRTNFSPKPEVEDDKLKHANDIEAAIAKLQQQLKEVRN